MENSLSPAAGRARAGATRVCGYAGRPRPIAGIATLLLVALSAAPLAAQHRIGMEPNVRFSIRLGFAPRG